MTPETGGEELANSFLSIPWQRQGRTFLLEPRTRRLRVEFAGRIVADTKTPFFYAEWRDPLELVQERAQNQYWMSMPFWYYVPREDVDESFLSDPRDGTKDKRIGRQVRYTLAVDGVERPNAAWKWVDLTEGGQGLAGLIGFDHHKAVTLYEEEDELPFGPRDMHHAIEARTSSRHVRVLADGVELASSSRPVLLYETGLPTRYYVPKQDVRLDLLEAQATRSACPWKGECRYWNVRGNSRFDEAIWAYESPLPGAEKIAHHIGFWHERGFEIHLDGELVPVPKNGYPRQPITFSYPR